MNELGNLGIVQFINLHKDAQTFHLPFGDQILRCDASLKKLE